MSAISTKCTRRDAPRSRCDGVAAGRRSNPAPDCRRRHSRRPRRGVLLRHSLRALPGRRQRRLDRQSDRARALPAGLRGGLVRVHRLRRLAAAAKARDRMCGWVLRHAAIGPDRENRALDGDDAGRVGRRASPTPLVTSSEDAAIAQAAPSFALTCRARKGQLHDRSRRNNCRVGLMLAPLTAQAADATVVLDVHHAYCSAVSGRSSRDARTRQGRDHRFGQVRRTRKGDMLATVNYDRRARPLPRR